MNSETAKLVIDRIVGEGVLKANLKSSGGDELEDLLHTEADQLLTRNSGYLTSMLQQEIDSLDVPDRDLPVDISVISQPSGRSIDPRNTSKVLWSYDHVVDFIMMWSVIKGYNTCKVMCPCGPQEDEVLSANEIINLVDEGYGDELYFVITDRKFYEDVSRWVAEKMVQLGLITAGSVNELIKRARIQP